MKARLLRFADSPFGVFGWWHLLDDAGEVLARFAICEDDWLANAQGISCIPAGSYRCVRIQSPRFGNTFHITNVPGREGIVCHWGNTEEDTRGCPLFGEDFGALTVRDEDAPGKPRRVKWGVVESKKAWDRFLEETAGLQEFPLTVEWAAPGSWRALVP